MRRAGAAPSVEDIGARYSGWDHPLFALRDALRHDPQRVEDDRSAWSKWLHDQGLDVAWLPRLSVEDERHGTVVVVDGAYEFPAPLPAVFGDVDDQEVGRSFVLTCDGARYWTTQDATVVGGWDVVTTRAGACWPALTPRVESTLVSNALDAQLLGWTPDLMIVRDDRTVLHRRARLRFGPSDRDRLDSAIALVGEHSWQYGHWMIDYLPRALAVRTLPASIPVLVDADVPPNGLWWLRKVLPGRPIVQLERGQAIDARALFVPLQRTFCPTGWIDSMEITPDVFSVDPSAVTQIQRLATADGPPPVRHRRVWLGRRGGHRSLLNHQELFGSGVGGEFEWVNMEDLSMPEAQRVLDEAKHVIAPTGSQVLNVLAARPGLRVLGLTGAAVELERGAVSVYGRACGHEVALVAGRQVGPAGRNPYEDSQRPFVIDEALLDTACREFFNDSR